jgi:hypothetical protein
LTLSSPAIHNVKCKVEVVTLFIQVFEVVDLFGRGEVDGRLLWFWFLVDREKVLPS